MSTFTRDDVHTLLAIAREAACADVFLNAALPKCSSSDLLGKQQKYIFIIATEDNSVQGGVTCIEIMLDKQGAETHCSLLKLIASNVAPSVALLPLVPQKGGTLCKICMNK